jgi:FKBP-type peptidyl-prolyl cis-trans isomerase
LKDVYTGNDQQLSQEKVEAALQKFQQKQIELQKLATAKAAVTAKSEADVKAKVSIEQGAKFLAENAKREGVTRLESGLQIEITHPGTGNKPTLSDTVVVHYAGKTLEGVEFDSSIKREKPATFPLDAVIPGWTEGLQLLKEGAKAKLYIPSKLAYGNQGAGPQIGPGETLIFEVELIEIVKKDAKK